MRRLIDADALIAECENAICPTASGRMVLRSVIRTIKKTPTAYDPDKVVEQLKDRSTLARPVGWTKSYEIVTLEDAIDIVKGECDYEQSCEWKLENAESNLYVTGCENRRLIFEGTPEENGYKHCPYCGRKIKEGGVD